MIEKGLYETYTKEQLIDLIGKLESINSKIFFQFLEVNEKLKQYEEQEKVKRLERLGG